MPRLDPRSLSPDPLYGRDADAQPIITGPAAGLHQAVLRPWRIGNADQPLSVLSASERDPWASQDPLTLTPHADAGARALCDFGSEVEGELDLAIEAGAAAVVYVSFGESLPEAMSWGLPPLSSHDFPPAKEMILAPAGRSQHVLRARGFRFVRIDAFDGGGLVRITVAVRAHFAGGKRHGDLRCSDAIFQRLWQASAYTARLCTRPQAFWDGIKRDRLGWYGDARITQASFDAVFADPRPAEQMLLAWPVSSWANGIPAFSFDGIAMFRQLVMAHGADRPLIAEIWSRMDRFMEWVLSSQVDDRLRLVRRDDVAYFFGIGFIDWSPQPLGGRFEELPWLQCAWCEALATAQQIAGWLGHHDHAARWGRAQSEVRTLIAGELWRDGGFPHTLQRATAQEEWRMPHQPDLHHRLSYLEKRQFGPSRPSRHAIARAAFAGLLDNDARRQVGLQVLDDPSIPGIITPYYQFYEQSARARLGDAAGGLRRMAAYVEAMLVPNDGATVWESFEPEVSGFARWSLHTFPKSLCHGWGSGLVPLCTRWLLGVEPLAPGFRRVALGSAAVMPWSFAATVPTPLGPLTVSRDGPSAPIEYGIPHGMEVVRR